MSRDNESREFTPEQLAALKDMTVHQPRSYADRVLKIGQRKVSESALTDGATRVNVNQEHDNVEVRWMFTPDPTGPHEAMVEANGAFRSVRGRHSYTVLVRSERFPHSKLVGEVAPEDVSNMRRVRKVLGVLAGALTEELNERFGDNVDPSQVARAAEQAYLEMVTEQKRALLQNTA